MTSKQESKLKMYLMLKIFLQSNEAVTATLPNFPEFMAALDAAILQIQTNDEQHQYNTKGVTDNKQQSKEALITATADASRKMQAFARYKNNPVLLAETKFTETYLKGISSIELLNSSNGIHTRINTFLPELTGYELTVESQATFKQVINNYAEAIPQTRQSQLGKMESNLKVDQGFETGDAATANIDSVVEIVRLSQPNFYQGYKNARKILAQGTGSLQVQGKIIDASTGLPIPDATASFSLSGQTAVVIEKQTAAKGGFNIKSLAEGIYDVTITKVGYQTQTVSATVSWDALCEVDVALVK
jgi:hypothetical protein